MSECSAGSAVKKYLSFLTAEIAESAEMSECCACSASSAVQRLIFLTAEIAESAEIKDRLNEVTQNIMGAAIEVHRALGPGLLESAYEACLAYELGKRGFKVERQWPLPVVYREVRLDCGYRIDLLVEESVIVELKAVDKLAPIHEAQLLSYLKLSGSRVGLLINFNVKVLKNGVRRIVNNFPA